MADLFGESSPPEHNNFDNDFEKLDPFSPVNAMEDELVSSTSPLQPLQPELPEEDLYTSSPQQSEAEPLIDVQEAIPEVVPSVIPSEPLIPEFAPQPVSSSTYDYESEKFEPPSPEPVAEPEPVKSVEKPSSTPGDWIKNVDPRVSEKAPESSTCSSLEPVVDLVYWRDIKKTGVVFGSVLVVLLSLALFSVLSVVAYLSLTALTVAISFRVYKNVLGAVQKTGEGHPFKQYLDVDIALPEDKVHQLADVVMEHISCGLKELRRLFLVEDMVDSIKFGLLLWVLTYIGAWFNGMTLIILGVVGAFTLPKVYETYKVQIDQYLDLVKTHVRNIVKQVQEKIPLPGKKKSA